jgi:hypothetical protein
MEWISDIVKAEFCPKCNYEKTHYILPDLYPAYINHIPNICGNSREDLTKEYLAV